MLLQGEQGSPINPRANRTVVTRLRRIVGLVRWKIQNKDLETSGKQASLIGLFAISCVLKYLHPETPWPRRRSPPDSNLDRVQQSTSSENSFTPPTLSLDSFQAPTPFFPSALAWSRWRRWSRGSGLTPNLRVTRAVARDRRDNSPNKGCCFGDRKVGSNRYRWMPSTRESFHVSLACSYLVDAVCMWLSRDLHEASGDGE